MNETCIYRLIAGCNNKIADALNFVCPMKLTAICRFLW